MTTHSEHNSKKKRFWQRRGFQKILILSVGIVLGALIILQARYFTSYVSTYGRDPGENIFREIQILKTTNQELEETIEELEIQLEDASSQAKVLDSIEDEIKKIQKLAGEVDIWGPGVEFEVDGDISAIWFVDIINELFSIGAEAVSINDIRITDDSSGFDTLPNGQIMLNSVILNKPYTFKAIGERSVLTKALEFPGGIIERLKNNYSGITTALNELDRIEMTVI
jgi:uncharacterized protein YlxW (UPF0749 family)